MKKFLLLVAAAASFSIASAQFVSYNETSVSNQAPGSQDEITILHSKASVTEFQRASMAKRLPTDGVWYKRPAGSLCFGLSGYGTVDNSGWSRYANDVLFLPAHSEVVFENASTAAGTKFAVASVGTSPVPTFQTEFEEADGKATLYTHGNGVYLPLKVFNSTKEYYFGIDAPEADKFAARFSCDTIRDYGFEEIPQSTMIWQWGGTGNYLVGRVTDRIDFNGDGKNETVLCDGFHMFFPKPLAPFAVKRINIPITSTTGDFFTGFEGLTFTIYKVKVLPNGSRAFGDVIFTAEVNDDYFPMAPGALVSGKQAHLTIPLTDDDSYITFTDEFAIELKGFQREGVELGTRTVKRYAAAQAEVNYSAVADPYATPLLYRDFVNKQGEYLGSSVYNNNLWGIPISFFGSYDVMKVDEYSNTITVSADGKSCEEMATTYTQLAWFNKAGQYLYELAGLPEWVKSVKANYVDRDVFDISVECEPLPAGVESRKCEVKIKSLFGNLSDDVITINQVGGSAGVKGDINGDGVVDIADVNTAIDIVLGLAGSVPTADVNGDGTVDVADINLIIDSILGL